MAALPAGTLARVQMAAVATTGESTGGSGGDSLAGFVLLLEDIGEEVRRAERSDRLLQDLTESVRSALAGMRAAVENLMNYPEMESARRQQFTGIISEEAGRLTVKLDRTMREYSEYVKSQRSLEQIRVADLIDVIRHRAEARLGLHDGHRGSGSFVVGVRRQLQHGSGRVLSRIESERASQRARRPFWRDLCGTPRLHRYHVDRRDAGCIDRAQLGERSSHDRR